MNNDSDFLNKFKQYFNNKIINKDHAENVEDSENKEEQTVEE